MKLTKKQLKKIIKEELGAPESIKQLTDELSRALKNGRGSPESNGVDEIYIMTGAGEGITVKVLRRGR